jgi:hypothetical protein
METVPPYSKSLGDGACFPAVEPCILLIRPVDGSLKYVLKESSQMCPVMASCPDKTSKLHIDYRPVTSLSGLQIHVMSLPCLEFRLCCWFLSYLCILFDRLSTYWLPNFPNATALQAAP